MEIDGQAQDSDSTSLGQKEKSQKLFSKVACAGCRAIKVKCRLSDGNIPSGPGEACTRCTRLQVPCEYKSSTRRGRKPKSLLEAERAAAKEEQDQLADTMDHRERSMSNAPTYPENGFPPPFASTSRLPPVSAGYGFLATSQPQGYPRMTMHPPQSLHPPTLPNPSPLATSRPLLQPLHHPMAQLPPPPPSVLEPRRPQSASSQTSSFSQHTGAASSIRSPASQASPNPAAVRLYQSTAESLADAAITKASSFGAADLSTNKVYQFKPTPTHPDPVDLHVLSSLEAAQLFELFHSRLNCFIILLDKKLHTPEFVRKSSTVLFTAILAVSAKFFRKDLYQSLLLSAQQLVVRGTGEGTNLHIGLIQACLLLVYWKEPQDDSAWIRTGFALRCAYQLGLHVKRKVPLPEDEFEARLILDRERTHITLICFDASYQLSFAASGVYETRMVTIHDVDISAWLQETKPYGVRDDWEQGASIGLIKVLNLLSSIANAPSRVIANAIVGLVNEMLAEVYSKYLDASSPSYQELSTLAQHKIRFHYLAASLQVGRSCLIAAGISDTAVLADFISRCGSLVECFEDLTAGDSPVFAFMQDNVSIQLMGFGEILGKLFPQVGASVQATLVDHLTRMYTAATTSARGDDNSVPAFVSRFFRAVLRSIHPLALRSTPPTRPGSPGGTHGGAPPVVSNVTQYPNPFEQLGGVEQELLIPDHNTLVASLRNDGSYWDSLFPGQSSWTWLDNALTQPDQNFPSF